MGIKEQFKLVTDFFEREKFDYAVIGAFALCAHGYTRATKDVDFISRIEYQGKIIGYLESLGFETLHRSSGFSNHLRSVGATRIDIMYVEGETARAIFSSVSKMKVLEDLSLPVISLDHLIALKLFAIKNEPGRKLKELSDIKELSRIGSIDAATLRELFKKYGQEKYYHEIAGEEAKN